MRDQDTKKPNRPQLALHVPEPNFRPGDTPDFSSVQIPAAGSAPKPDVTASAAETEPLTTGLVRVLDDNHKAVGPWDPKLDADTLRKIVKDVIPGLEANDRVPRPEREPQAASG